MVARPRNVSADLETGSPPESFAQYRAELRRFFARRARVPHSADDLVQDVYEAVLRYPAADAVKDPLSYLFKIAWRVVRLANRRSQQAQHLQVGYEESEVAARIEDVSASEGGEVLAQDEIQAVLQELPRACQVALIRHRRDGWTYQEIAEELNVSPNTVKDYVVKALRHFRAHFEGQIP